MLGAVPSVGSCPRPGIPHGWGRPTCAGAGGTIYCTRQVTSVRLDPVAGQGRPGRSRECVTASCGEGKPGRFPEEGAPLPRRKRGAREGVYRGRRRWTLVSISGFLKRVGGGKARGRRPRGAPHTTLLRPGQPGASWSASASSESPGPPVPGSRTRPTRIPPGAQSSRWVRPALPGHSQSPSGSAAEVGGRIFPASRDGSGFLELLLRLRSDSPRMGGRGGGGLHSGGD